MARRTTEPSTEEHGPIKYSTRECNCPSPDRWGPRVNPRDLNGLEEPQQERRARCPDTGEGLLESNGRKKSRDYEAAPTHCNSPGRRD
ncbi:hypothetical protein NDU88_001185 [Pleurodeles waltl]|uniref:Uncharacterized protein n=1 Tax=Pleurodeles waltl TaxID=8319 RepID=A0AAV7VVR1_PLEWA|nr:hypothetical protein NDU88_001185 [Pleurodeles waltl]